MNVEQEKYQIYGSIECQVCQMQLNECGRYGMFTAW